MPLFALLLASEVGRAIAPHLGIVPSREFSFAALALDALFLAIGLACTSETTRMFNKLVGVSMLSLGLVIATLSATSWRSNELSWLYLASGVAAAASGSRLLFARRRLDGVGARVQE